MNLYRVEMYGKDSHGGTVVELWARDAERAVILAFRREPTMVRASALLMGRS